jgi:hypothetical protein
LMLCTWSRTQTMGRKSTINSMDIKGGNAHEIRQPCVHACPRLLTDAVTDDGHW